MSTPTLPDASKTAAPAASRRMVDAPIRMFHGLFVVAFFGAYLTAESHSLRPLHATLGYVVIGLLAFRVVYGIVGPPQARLSLMWRKLKGAPAWLRSLGGKTAATASPWQQGQNLLMVLLIVLLLALAIPLVASGYGIYNGWDDQFGHWLEELHEVLGNGLFALALGHIALVLLLSVLRKKNMPWTMVTGRTRGVGPDLVKKPRTWLAALMALAALGFGAWQWQQTPGGLISGSNNARKERKEKRGDAYVPQGNPQRDHGDDDDD